MSKENIINITFFLLEKDIKCTLHSHHLVFKFQEMLCDMKILVHLIHEKGKQLWDVQTDKGKT